MSLILLQLSKKIMSENMSISNISQGKSRARPGYFDHEAIEVMKEWLEENLSRPYVHKSDIKDLSKKSGLSKKQIMGWCTNVRRRRLTIIRDDKGARQLVPQKNPEKKRKQNKSGTRAPIVLKNERKQSPIKNRGFVPYSTTAKLGVYKGLPSFNYDLLEFSVVSTDPKYPCDDSKFQKLEASCSPKSEVCTESSVQIDWADLSRFCLCDWPDAPKHV
ncbi:unnamed protein product [Moneuplotes crassus]|uniref:Homeobox domain-containing protein n=1 Tax=Euplotes crassus TaxID=5936 RepID=A0AAD2CZ31_EUPCR|nr:unnamed protein product [Moneuplotes crassus]